MIDKDRRIELLERALVEYIQRYGLTDLAREVMTVPPWSGTKAPSLETRDDKAAGQARKRGWNWRT